ncbi:hypothetical protein I8748_22345 [Nostoc sp. CENA67]|uniref:Uncharacterized protein n=1 Tax=Amazonocrinis nigriterrae CENA67 TaxID=2794033 RepID=A0A8J7L8W4_9NOST|nr:hypothetical protein [Amazonocrinis nigriterrae]MBH8564889.1 hypothetical protein [Amazonocrinis nigriterrae CENA67]
MNRVAEAASFLSLLNLQQQRYDQFFDTSICFFALAIPEFLITVMPEIDIIL